MKKIEKEVKMMKTFYVASDGTEFDTPIDCKEYDDRIKIPEMQNAGKVPHVIWGASSVELFFWDETQVAIMFDIRNIDDLIAVDRWLKVTESEIPWNDFNRVSFIGKKIVFRGYQDYLGDEDDLTSLEDGCGYIGTVDDWKAMYVKNIDMMIDDLKEVETKCKSNETVN